MTINEFSNDDLNHFKEYGYILVKKVFPTDIANECKEFLWDVMNKSYGYDPNDPSSWIDSKCQLSNVYTCEPFKSIFSNRLNNCIDEICGIDNTEPSNGAGWFTITFPQHHQGPWDIDGHFHIDGTGFTHYTYSKEVGLVLLILISDVHNDWGGTAIAEKSHISSIRMLTEAGKRGIVPAQLSLSVREQSFDLIETTGCAGDIIIMHPLMLHARSKNLGPNNLAGVRFLCHPIVPLKNHMNFNKDYNNMTILEQSYVDAIKLSSSSESSAAYWLDILKSITPEACAEFRNKRKINKMEDKESIKMVRFDDEDGTNPCRYDKSDDILDNDNQLEILQTMGFFQFGSKR